MPFPTSSLFFFFFFPSSFSSLRFFQSSSVFQPTFNFAGGHLSCFFFFFFLLLICVFARSRKCFMIFIRRFPLGTVAVKTEPRYLSFPDTRHAFFGFQSLRRLESPL
ncbi:hypothetical protein IWX90DRAFT_213186 [Phyllosticta citrichinensis]|uniref:Secreted protein n=1 Tax=Phyllosticta citrichinensis TaxID=1130410 RepID=A0ABR1XTJ5_9PEZI